MLQHTDHWSSTHISANLHAQLGWCQCCDSVEWEGGRPLKAGGFVGEGVPAAPHGQAVLLGHAGWTCTDHMWTQGALTSGCMHNVPTNLHNVYNPTCIHTYVCTPSKSPTNTHVRSYLGTVLNTYLLTAPQTTALTHHRPFWGQKEHRLPMHYFPECSGSKLGHPVAGQGMAMTLHLLSIFCMYVGRPAAHACMCACTCASIHGLYDGVGEWLSDST